MCARLPLFCYYSVGPPRLLILSQHSPSATRSHSHSHSHSLHRLTPYAPLPLPPQNVRPGGGGAAHPGGSTIRSSLSIPKEFPGLLELTCAELGTLLTDPAAFAQFLHSTEGCREARAFTRDLRIEIEGMCRTNIEMAEEAGDLRSQMQVIRSCDMQPVKEGYDAVKARADALLRRYNLPKLLQGLKDRTAAADAACEELSEEYVAGKVPLDEFVEKYRKMREAYHRDAVKVSIVAPALQSQQSNHQRQHQQQHHQRY